MNKADALPIVWNFKRENAVESKAMVIMTTKFIQRYMLIVAS